MTDEFRKEAYRLFWLVKGHLGCHDWQDEDIIKMHDSYFRRLWNNESGCLDIYEEGFEEAYEALIGKT
jgi:hypothetical protein